MDEIIQEQAEGDPGGQSVHANPDLGGDDTVPTSTGPSSLGVGNTSSGQQGGGNGDVPLEGLVGVAVNFGGPGNVPINRD
jgi:hypothetical protein